MSRAVVPDGWTTRRPLDITKGPETIPYVMVPTILRVIDEEIEGWEDVSKRARSWGHEHRVREARYSIMGLRTLRSRFEPDTQGGDR